VQYQPTGWYKATIPTTVLAAQVAAGEFPDPYFGMNLRNIPGTTYKIGNEFSREQIPADSPYACSWWYRTTFRTPDSSHVALHFDGINYRANIWLNGEKIADAKDVAGAYRTYAFNLGGKLAKNGTNALAVEVFAPSEKDLGINWVDWNPAPPDKDMGLWSKVYLTYSRGVEIRYPAVYTHFVDESLASAELTVVTELHNASSKQIDGVFRASIPELKLAVRKSITLAPNETRAITLTPGLSRVEQAHVTEKQ
jgi:exo-1,4-beta-D-glucosaminidase